MAYLFKNCLIVADGAKRYADVLVKKDRIERIAPEISDLTIRHVELDAEGKYLLPGMIDDQVHFREPGYTHKADMATESRAAVAGGVTSYMEMPNTKPQATTARHLEAKFARAKKVSAANFSFYMGATNDNLRELLDLDPHSVCGIKVFMGSSTGNMLVDNETTLENIFSKCSHLIATHCESEDVIRANMRKAADTYGEDIPMDQHPAIRSVEACFASSSRAVELAKKHGTRLHVLHISTEKELALFGNKEPLETKRITAEACVHHMWFDSGDYARLGSLIKCNPAIKAAHNREAIVKAVANGTIDVVATDHAPHTWTEKQGKYQVSPSGLPLVQHPLLMLLDLVEQGKLDLETVVERTSGAVAKCFGLRERGYLREGYKADLVLVSPGKPSVVENSKVWYKCGWTPLDGHRFGNTIESTYVNGVPVYEKGRHTGLLAGERLLFG
ncbi:MAG: dihydroorotase [Bacteroidetes bacterium]|nr:dihydroorotase [Bacteroidota bacterium]